MLKPWKVLKSRRDTSYRLFDIRTEKAVSPRTGKTHEFYILESQPWVNVIPLTPDKEVVLIRQYRHGIKDMTLEVPGGLVEEEDRPESAALRELREETGYVGSKAHYLGQFHPNPAIQNNLCYTYLVPKVSKISQQDLDEKEDIEVVLKPLTAIPDLIKQRWISHSLVMCAFFLYFLQKQPDLIEF